MSWKDVTGICLDASQTLDNERSMIYVDGFSLKDTMAAVELMDKKMDQCCGLEGSIESEELLAPEIPDDSELDLSLLLKILRILVIYEAGFLDGASVLESTHTCVYLWEGSWAKISERQGLTTRIILAYCRSLHQSLRHLTKIVLDVDIYEDEDFQPQLTPMLGDSLLDQYIGDELNSVISELEKSKVVSTDKEEVIALMRTRMAVNELVAAVMVGASSHLVAGSEIRKKEGVVPKPEDRARIREQWGQVDAKLEAASKRVAALQQT